MTAWRASRKRMYHQHTWRTVATTPTNIWRLSRSRGKRSSSKSRRARSSLSLYIATRSLLESPAGNWVSSSGLIAKVLSLWWIIRHHVWFPIAIKSMLRKHLNLSRECLAITISWAKTYWSQRRVDNYCLQEMIKMIPRETINHLNSRRSNIHKMRILVIAASHHQ